MSGVRIPITAARRIAEDYGYDQVVIVARCIDKPGESGNEHVTTYGVDKTNCDVAARIGNFFKHKLMGWPRSEEPAADQTVRPNYTRERGSP